MIFVVRLLLFLLVVVVVYFVVFVDVHNVRCVDYYYCYLGVILLMSILICLPLVWAIVFPVTVCTTVVTIVRVVPARTVVSVVISPFSSWSLLIVVVSIV